MNRKLLAELLELPPDERRAIAEELWDSLGADDREPSELTLEQKAEIDRRIAEHERDPSSAVPWEIVMERVRARYK
jgi:putative addiction module component (TIGR02574 family)